MEIYTTIRLWSYGDVLKVMEIYTTIRLWSYGDVLKVMVYTLRHLMLVDVEVYNIYNI